MIVQFIDEIYARFLNHQLGLANLHRVRLVLQEICKLYRKGFAFRPAIRSQVEVVVVGQLNSHQADTKLRRWCLNVLALIGTTERSQASIERVLATAHNDPDTMTAAITAYFRVTKDAFAKLSKLDIASEELVTLAAIKGGYAAQVKPSENRIKIDTANPAVLRSALLGVGLDKLPENMFEPNHANSAVVGKLIGHDDNLVSQYSVWAVAENPNLTAADLTIDIRNLDDQSKNVRGWVYRLYAQEPEYSHERHELIERGSVDDFVEGRRNLALGLSDAYYDGLEEIVLPWFADEEDEEIQALIIDHMVKNGDQSTSYQSNAVQFFKEYPIGSPKRERMQVMASGTSLFKRFKQISYEGDGDLFSLNAGGDTVTHNYNIKNVQGGAVSLGGDSTNHGLTNNALSVDQVCQLNDLLSELQAELEQYSIDESIIGPVNAEIAAIKSNPEPSRLKKLTSMIESSSALSTHVEKLAGNAKKIVAIGVKIATFLGGLGT